MTVKIETGIPIPLEAANGKGRRKYPWVELEVGQSFLATGGAQKTIATGASVFSKRLGRKFRTAKVAGGTRVWRVA